MSGDIDKARHKTKTWHNLTHWQKPNETWCGTSGASRWHWRNVTCADCLAALAAKVANG